MDNDDNITWETTTISNLGVDASFLNGKFTTSLEYFIKTTDDVLRPVGIPYQVGALGGPIRNIGKSIRILELFGLPGVKNLNQYYKDKNFKKFENLNLISDRNISTSVPFCPIILGLSFLDQVNTMEQIKRINFERIAYPIIFISFLSRASEIIGKKIFLKIEEKEFLLNLNLSIYSNYLKNEILESCNIINISFIENNNSFNDGEWNELYKLSEDTFVDETESLKVGAAGAGLTDND